MTFIEYDDCFLWECDSCGKQIAFKPHHFSDCVDELKERGWGFVREDEGWRHRCGRCQYNKRMEHQRTDLMERHFKTVK